MKKITYKELVESVEKIDTILSELGIEYRSHDRILQAIRLIKELDVVKENDDKRKEFMILNNKSGQIFTSLVELFELKHILENSVGWDKNVLKEKLVKILDGTLILSKETPKNSHARNIFFELSLAAEFKRAGLNANINAINPDISVNIKERTYFIQCKRVFSENRLRKLIGEAKSQLINDLDTNNGENYGVIALSLSRMFTNGLYCLDSKSSVSALQYLDFILLEFINKYSEIWKSITDKRIIAIILQVSLPVVLREESMIAWGRQITVNNIHDNDSLAQLEVDFKGLNPNS